LRWTIPYVKYKRKRRVKEGNAVNNTIKRQVFGGAAWLPAGSQSDGNREKALKITVKKYTIPFMLGSNSKSQLMMLEVINRNHCRQLLRIIK
jgi:hypothetical protein